MRIHCIQHVPFEGLGYIESWSKENKHPLTITKVWEQMNYPAMGSFDLLIIMGGPMGVYDDHQYKWLTDEKNFLSDAVAEKKNIIGICLGAQLLACMLGAAVSANKHKEIGWFPVKINASFSRWLGYAVTDEMTVFHWHGDQLTFLRRRNHASSEACNYQLFTFGDHIIGLQFHLEATRETVNEMIKFGKDELTQGYYIQDAGFMLDKQQYFEQSNYLMKKVLEKFMD